MDLRTTVSAETHVTEGVSLLKNLRNDLCMRRCEKGDGIALCCLMKCLCARRNYHRKEEENISFSKRSF